MPQKILIVDDDADFRREFRGLLEGYEILESGNSQEALNLLKRANEIGLVILDVMMPGLNGIEVLKEIKRIDPDMGVVILTGYSSKDVAVEALKAHADDLIEKPLDIPKIKEIADRFILGKHGREDIDITDINGKIKKVKLFTQLNRFKKITLNEAAKAVCLSPKYLSRIFKERAGSGYNQYKLKVKINQAKELLKRRAFNINQVSEKIGYKNTESFIRIFKKNTGLTPTQYRIKFRKNNGKKPLR